MIYTIAYLLIAVLVLLGYVRWFWNDVLNGEDSLSFPRFVADDSPVLGIIASVFLGLLAGLFWPLVLAAVLVVRVATHGLKKRDRA